MSQTKWVLRVITVIARKTRFHSLKNITFVIRMRIIESGKELSACLICDVTLDDSLE